VGAASVTLDGVDTRGDRIASQLHDDDQVVVSADSQTPFGNVNLLITQLLPKMRVIGVDALGTVHEVKLGRRHLEPSGEPSLLVIVVGSGISLKAPGGNVAPGCLEPGAGVAIPRTAEAPDYKAASACMSRLKAATGVVRYHLVADTAIPFSEVVATVQALNSGGGQWVGLRVF